MHKCVFIKKHKFNIYCSIAIKLVYCTLVVHLVPVSLSPAVVPYCYISLDTCLAIAGFASDNSTTSKVVISVELLSNFVIFR